MSEESNTATIFVGALGVFGTILASVVSWAAGRAPGLAAQQNAFNQSFEQYREAMDKRLADLEGELRAEKQYTLSLVEWLRRNGHDVPQRPPPAEVVFMVPPTKIHGAH